DQQQRHLPLVRLRWHAFAAPGQGKTAGAGQRGRESMAHTPADPPKSFGYVLGSALRRPVLECGDSSPLSAADPAWSPRRAAGLTKVGLKSRTPRTCVHCLLAKA